MNANTINSLPVPICYFRPMKLQPEDTGAMTVEYHYECSVCGNIKPMRGKAAK